MRPQTTNKRGGPRRIDRHRLMRIIMGKARPPAKDREAMKLHLLTLSMQELRVKLGEINNFAAIRYQRPAFDIGRPMAGDLKMDAFSQPKKT